MNTGTQTSAIRSRIPRIVISIMFAVLAVSGIVWASIPDQGGIIHGCSDKITGLARIIDTSRAQCLPTETKVSWNQAGQPGPTGPQGPQGIQGIQGPAGTAGATFKAAALVDFSSGAIVRCQNNITGETTPPCGFSFTTFSAGDPTTIACNLNFGFAVDNEFVSVTPFAQRWS